MASVFISMTFFHYVHKDTILHRMDGRVKLLCLLLLSLSASFASEPLHYLALSCLAASALFAAKLPVAAILGEMKFFAALILLVLVSYALTIPGDPVPGIPFYISAQGVAAGLRFAARLILILLVCTVMTGTTSLLTFRNAIEWYLRPVPFIPEARVAMMINLTFALIPVLFDSYTEMTDAQKSRCAELRKNPIRRVGFIAFPLLRQTLRRADGIVYAMESRCYSETRTRAVFQGCKTDWLLLAVCAAAALFCIGVLRK